MQSVVQKKKQQQQLYIMFGLSYLENRFKPMYSFNHENGFAATEFKI